MTRRVRAAAKALPIITSVALVLAACGSDGDESSPVAQSPDEAAVPAAAPAAAPESAEKPAATKSTGGAESTEAAPGGKLPAASAPSEASKTTKTTKTAKTDAAEAPKAEVAAADITVKSSESAGQKAENQKIYEAANGATDVGVTRDTIKLGSINMHGMALGNVLTAPQAARQPGHRLRHQRPRRGPRPPAADRGLRRRPG